MSRSSTVTPMTIGIVGLGPRGLGILERLLTLATCLPDKPIKIISFDPNEPGVGLHASDQPDYLMLNTIAGQLTMFPDEAAIDSPGTRTGPGFYEWCHAQGIRVDREGMPCTTNGRNVDKTDFLPRQLLGQYLAWVYRTITANLPANVIVTHESTKVEKIVPNREGNVFIFKTQADREYACDRVFITIGHSARKIACKKCSPAMARIIHQPYPLPASVDVIEPGARVGVAGLGLAAMDVLAALTRGRGGYFTYNDKQEKTYHPSGSEPRLNIYSRTGLPFCARPDTVENRDRHRAVFLTDDRIDTLREQESQGRLDFEKTILPVMKNEMRAAFYILSAELYHDPLADAANTIRDRLTAADGKGQLSQAFSELAVHYGAFDPDNYLLYRLPESLSNEHYTAWFKAFITNDLTESRKGLPASPLKTAIEVWRDLRDILRSIVDHQGLTEQSRRWFYSLFTQVINRLVAGPQKERHEDLLALMEAGVVTLVPPAQHGELDYIVHAQTGFSGVVDTDSAVVSSLHSTQLIEPVSSHPGEDGIAVNRYGNPILRRAAVHKNLSQRLWIFGPVCEGATYYNHYVPSGGSYSKAMADAHRAAIQCLGVDEATIRNAFNGSDSRNQAPTPAPEAEPVR